MKRFSHTPDNFNALISRVKSREATGSDDDLDDSDGDKET